MKIAPALIPALRNLVTLVHNKVFGIRTKNYVSSIKFRIVFVSPFFELEVDAGGGWHTVHSQDGVEVGNEQILMYPILRFKSFEDGLNYATNVLGLTEMKSKTFGIYMQPPASYEGDATPRLLYPQYVVDGKPVSRKEVAVDQPNDKLLAFTVYEGGKKPAVWQQRNIQAAA